MVHRAQRGAARAAIARGKGANAALKASIADAETQRQEEIAAMLAQVREASAKSGMSAGTQVN